MHYSASASVVVKPSFDCPLERLWSDYGTEYYQELVSVHMCYKCEVTPGRMEHQCTKKVVLLGFHSVKEKQSLLW